MRRNRCLPDTCTAHGPPGAPRTARLRPILALILAIALLPACSDLAVRLGLQPEPVADEPTPTGFNAADVGLCPAAPAPADPNGEVTPRSRQARVAELEAMPTTFTIFLVEVPRSRRAAMDKLWNYAREDTLDGETVWRLHRNGLRVGVGETRWWEQVRAVIGAVDGHRATAPESWRIPQHYPVLLNLETDPREHTIFYVGFDGVLSGNTWPRSRAALQLLHARDMVDLRRDILTVTPVIAREDVDRRQADRGMPREAGRAYPEAGFSLPLNEGEFILIAPSEHADLPGLLGTELLTRGNSAAPYDCYIFIRPDVAYGS